MEEANASFFEAAPWGKSVRTMTGFFLALLVLVSAFCLWAAISSAADSVVGAAVLLAASMLGPAIILLVAALAPRGYLLSSERITVVRRLKRVQVPLAEIEELCVMDGRQAFQGARRSMASGGAFGYFGQFYSQQFRTFDAYVTSLDKVVVIGQTKGHTVIVSPSRLEEFVTRIEELRKHQQEPSSSSEGRAD